MGEQAKEELDAVLSLLRLTCIKMEFQQRSHTKQKRLSFLTQNCIWKKEDSVELKQHWMI